MISAIPKIGILVVAALHLLFMVLETFLWTTPRGRRIFRQSAEDAQTTKILAQNQGIYNGMLGIALIYAALTGAVTTAAVLLVLIVVVGVFGAVTAKRSILYIQARPAAVVLSLLLLLH
jgi:putative membrane protein